MRERLLVSFALVDLAFALGLAVSYGVFLGGCGPPSFECFLQGGCMIFVCGNSWREFPDVMTFGALSGLLAATVGTLAAWSLPRPSARRDLFVEAIAVPAGVVPLASLAGVPGLVLGLLAWPVVAGLLVALSAPLLLRESRLPLVG